jgi:Mrp family chromosome partitioning ATPase/capsular polysaccharide biosynthesis protein
VDFVAFVRLVRRRRVLIVVLTLLGAALGAGSAYLGGETEPAATEKASFVVATQTLNFDRDALTSNPMPQLRSAEQVATLATSDAVLERASAELGTTPDRLGETINTYTRQSLGSVDVVVFGRDADAASTAVAAVVDSLLADYATRTEERVAALSTALSDRLAGLSAQRRALDAQLASPDVGPSDRDEIEAERDAVINTYRVVYERLQRLGDVEINQTSLVATDPARVDRVTRSVYDAGIARAQAGANHLVAGDASDSEAVAGGGGGGGGGPSGPLARGILGAVLGCVVGIGVAIGRERLDSRLHTRQDFEGAFSLPVLGEVPILTSSERKQRQIVSVTAPFSRAAEAYRSIRSSLLLLAADVQPAGSSSGLVVMVASPRSREGKSTTTANLAVVFAEAGLRVAAVNCDFRRPSLHRLFDVANQSDRVAATSVPGVSVVANVAANAGLTPTGVVVAQRALIQDLRARFDVIVVDTAPLLATNDPVDLSPVADLAVLVGWPSVTRADDAQRAHELLERYNVPVAGVVVVAADSVSNDYYYYYSRQAPPERDSVATPGSPGSNGSTRPTDGAGIAWRDGPGVAPRE